MKITRYNPVLEQLRVKGSVPLHSLHKKVRNVMALNSDTDYLLHEDSLEGASVAPLSPALTASIHVGSSSSVLLPFCCSVMKRSERVLHITILKITQS